jgi:hypothetical protein
MPPLKSFTIKTISSKINKQLYILNKVNPNICKMMKQITNEIKTSVLKNK